MANPYDTDGFNTVTLRPDRSTLAAVTEGPLAFRYLDSVVMTVAGIETSDPSALLFTAIDAEGNELARLLTSTTWQYVPGRKTSVYATVVFDLTGAETLSNATDPGRAAPIRLYLRDPNGRTLLDTSAEFYPCPADGTAGTPVASVVLKSALAAAVSAVRAMPSQTAAQREERFLKLLEKLEDASQ